MLQLIIMKKVTTLLGVALAGVLLLTSCSSEPKNSEQALYAQVVDTVCTISKHNPIEKEDVDKLNKLIIDMENYKGSNQEKINNTGKELKQYSVTFTTLIGVQQEPSLRRGMEQSCSVVKKEYDKKYAK